MRSVSTGSLMCIVMLVKASLAVAQEKGPCAGDVAKFCGNAKQGDGRIVGCLRQNETQLSPGCKVHLAQVKEAVKEAHAACEDDIVTYCGRVQPGGGRIMQCLKANKHHLSFRCKRKLFEAKQQML